MDMIVEHSTLPQSGIDWAEGLGLVPVLVSGLCPFTFLCLSSLRPADVGGGWF